MLSLGELVHCKRLFHVFIEYSPLLLQPNIAGPFDSSEVPLGLDLLFNAKSQVFSQMDLPLASWVPGGERGRFHDFECQNHGNGFGQNSGNTHSECSSKCNLLEIAGGCVG